MVVLIVYNACILCYYSIGKGIYAHGPVVSSGSLRWGRRLKIGCTNHYDLTIYESHKYVR